MIHQVTARNVQEAYRRGLDLVRREGEREDTRNGPALVVPGPVVTTLMRPLERVLLDPSRDANPFFHLMEAFWMLAGRRDVASIARFLPRMADFSDDGVNFHAAYGHRWRRHHDVEGGSGEKIPDQLRTIILALRENPADRRLVLAMWDPVADLGREGRDFPCNTHVYFRTRRAPPDSFYRAPGLDTNDMPCQQTYLDVTVCNRSNDAILGLYGANAVHMSVLHEFVAAMSGLRQGRMHTLSNNMHAYVGDLERVSRTMDITGDAGAQALLRRTHDMYDVGFTSALPLFRTDATLDVDLVLSQLEAWWAQESGEGRILLAGMTPEGRETVDYVRRAHELRSVGAHGPALQAAERIAAPDWRMACTEWLLRRRKT